MSRGQAREAPDGGRGGDRRPANDEVQAASSRRAAVHRTRDETERPVSRRGLRVLVVEDSHAIVDRIIETLAAELPIDYVEAVDSEPDALATEGPWDAAIVDLSLREGNGFSVLRALQRRGEPRPFVVVLSDYARPEFRSLAATFGARVFLHKTTEFERLPDVLRPVAAERSASSVRH